jgi:ABC-type protease/lipase transport system fused ATPase/permease subunit
MRGATPDLWRSQLEASRVQNPLLLTWEDVGCAYSTPSGIKRVLQDVSGSANPFEVLALMGPSGAGAHGAPLGGVGMCMQSLPAFPSGACSMLVK